MAPLELSWQQGPLPGPYGPLNNIEVHFVWFVDAHRVKRHKFIAAARRQLKFETRPWPRELFERSAGHVRSSFHQNRRAVYQRDVMWMLHIDRAVLDLHWQFD